MRQENHEVSLEYKRLKKNKRTKNVSWEQGYEQLESSEELESAGGKSRAGEVQKTEIVNEGGKEEHAWW